MSLKRGIAPCRLSDWSHHRGLPPGANPLHVGRLSPRIFFTYDEKLNVIPSKPDRKNNGDEGQQAGPAVRLGVSAPAGIAAAETVSNLWLPRLHLSTQSLHRLWNRPFKLAKSVAAEADRLFSSVQSPAQDELGPPFQQALSTTVRGGAELRVRRAQVLFESLHAARAAYLRDPGQGGSLELNLFEDVGFKAVVLRSAPTASGYSLSGRLEGVPHGTVTLVVNGDVLIGTVRTPQAIYTVESGGSDPARIRQVDPSVLPPLGEPLVLPPRGSAQPEATSATRIAAVDDDQLIRIDVLVVYTSEVRRLKGDRAMVEALVDHWIADANHAYADSGVYQRLFLARAAEVVYEETGNSSTDIERLLSSDDGFMDSVCESASGLGADRRFNLLILKGWRGSLFHAD